MVPRQGNIRQTAGGRSARDWLGYALCNLWQGIREWCGDSAYERYVHAQRLLPEEGAVLTREEFYVEQLNRRYSRPSRCC